MPQMDALSRIMARITGNLEEPEVVLEEIDKYDVEDDGVQELATIDHAPIIEHGISEEVTVEQIEDGDIADVTFAGILVLIRSSGFGGYANVSTIDTILDKADVTLEELLDESDLIQELKQHNTKLIEYLREEKILERLLEYVVAPKLAASATNELEPDTEEKSDSDNGKGKEASSSRSRDSEGDDEDEKEKKRNRYAYVSAEILSSDNWSICEALMENQPLLRKFWDFLKLPPPLDPLQASYFTKVNEALLDKKTEEMLELFKSLDGAVKNMLQHVDSPMVMDLLLKIISLEKAEGGQGIVDV
jgi:SIT4-associating protein SAP185/190